MLIKQSNVKILWCSNDKPRKFSTTKFTCKALSKLCKLQSMHRNTSKQLLKFSSRAVIINDTYFSSFYLPVCCKL